MMSTDPRYVLRSQHRRHRGTPLVWAFVCVLFAALCAGAAHLGWSRYAAFGGPVLSGAAIGCLFIWFVRARRFTQQALARHLDTEWKLSSRLESSHELANDKSAFAAAVRADAARQVASRKIPPAPWWHGGLVVLGIAALLFVVQSGILISRLFAQPPEIAQPAPIDISASIEWVAPDPEIKATAIEEIPLSASATTTTGFRSVTLEVSVNGQPVLSRPLDAATLETLAKPGTHSIQLPLYLDELAVEPFDIVAYHLLADRLTPKPAPAVASPLQFIQVRPARDDAHLLPGSGGPPPKKNEGNFLTELKIAQLTLLKQNFLLAHAPIPKSDPTWSKENTRVCADQAVFADKVVEACAFAVAKAFPTLIVDNLTQVEPLAREAAALMEKTENTSALPIQGRALALIVEIEKLFSKVIPQGGPPPPPGISDPFKDEQRYRLPQRKDTPAGRLENLAEKQGQQDSENGNSSDRSPQQKAAAAKQADLAKQMDELASTKKLSPAAQKAAEQAARDAKQAAEQLKQNDSAAARSPSAAAAQSLKEGVAAQEASGRATALAQLDAARRALNQAAPLPDAGDRARRYDEVARELEADAVAQQERGSAEAARQLQAAARSARQAAAAAAEGRDQVPAPSPSGTEVSGSSPSSGSGSQSGDTPGLGPGGQPNGETSGGEPAPASPIETATVAVAGSEAALAGRRASVERALRQLEAAQAGTSPQARSTRQLAAQLADAVLRTAQSTELRRRIEGGAGLGRASSVPEIEVQQDVEQLRALLEAALSSDSRDEIVRRFNPDDVPADYRDAVERYFEQLSRDAQ